MLGKYLLPAALASLCLAACTQKNPPAPATETPANYYTEAHRPQFHFSPEKMWMNDPNGMVYYDGEYHLFYQYYPDSTVWGPMHWGHAVSTDLVHWQHLPIALYPDTLGYIFSGSAVVDPNNTSGFGAAGKPPLVAIFTHHDPAGEKAGRNNYQVQSLAYSTDRGRSWTKYAGNPAIPNPGKRDFRDPKVFWHEGSKQWILALAVYDHVEFWGAPDLKNWKHLSDFGRDLGAHSGVWECPDLFPIPIDGTAESKWVLLLSINPGGPNGGSATQYFVGNFDGTNFQIEPGFLEPKSEKAIWLDGGRDNYAGVTWSGIPASDGRRLFLGWMSNWAYAQVVPTQTWRSAMTAPRTLHLKKTAQGLRLYAQPVQELQALRDKGADIPAAPTLADNPDLGKLTASPSPTREVTVDLSWTPGAAPFGLELFNEKGESLRVGYDPAAQQLFVDRSKSGKMDFAEGFGTRVNAAYAPTGNTIRLHALIDVASVELFADEGACVMTEIFFPNQPFTGLRLFGDNKAQAVKGQVWNLKGTW